MFDFLKGNRQKRHELTFSNSDQSVTTLPNETVLQAAERAGVTMPYRCRVGGCGTCKCRLLAGEIKPLTEFSYVLSSEQLQEGYILACQSVPKSDIKVEIDLQKLAILIEKNLIKTQVG